MAEQRKLPFVWELDNKGIISHAIATRHSAPDIYREDIRKYCAGKKHVLTESYDYDSLLESIDLREMVYKMLSGLKNEPRNFRQYIELKQMAETIQALDHIIQETADEMKITNVGLETPEEQTETGKIYDKAGEILGFSDDVIDAYENGSTQAMMQLMNEKTTQLKNKLTKEEFEKHMKRNATMAERSLPYMKAPTLIAAGTYHFFQTPTILDFYKEKGIKIKKI